METGTVSKRQELNQTVKKIYTFLILKSSKRKHRYIMLGYQSEVITSKGYINVKKTCNRLSGPRHIVANAL